jgi:hypothetical protein
VRALGVVPFDPLGNSTASFGETGEVMQPDALLEITKEALDEALALERNELLTQTVIAARRCESAGSLEDEAVVEDMPMPRASGSVGLPGATTQRELIASLSPIDGQSITR